jgi:hypothetical protein
MVPANVSWTVVTRIAPAAVQPVQRAPAGNPEHKER